MTATVPNQMRRMGNCKRCYYWTEVGDYEGECHRFPAVVRTPTEHYCGEFADKGEPGKPTRSANWIDEIYGR